MKIAIGNDHSAVELKNIIVDFLKEKGIEVLNLGTDSSESCDYPVYGEKVGRAVVSGEADLGIAICRYRFLVFHWQLTSKRRARLRMQRAVHSGDVPPPQRCQCTLLRRPRGRK